MNLGFVQLKSINDIGQVIEGSLNQDIGFVTNAIRVEFAFDYQSVRHCSKTRDSRAVAAFGLITSQFDTAPKLYEMCNHEYPSLITSQFDTAPKPPSAHAEVWNRLITSQFDTAPKRKEQPDIPTLV